MSALPPISGQNRRGALLQLLQPQVAAIVIVGDVPSTQCDWSPVQGRQLDSPDPESLPLVARIESTPEKLK